MLEHSRPEPDAVDTGTGEIESVWPKPTWTAVSLDLLGFHEI